MSKKPFVMYFVAKALRTSNGIRLLLSVFFLFSVLFVLHLNQMKQSRHSKSLYFVSMVVLLIKPYLFDDASPANSETALSLVKFGWFGLESEAADTIAAYAV